MRSRVTSWLAWALAGLSLSMFVAGVAITLLSLSGAPDTRPSSTWGTAGALAGLVLFLPFLAFPLVGALVASRRPENPIGWICLVAGLFWMFIVLGDTTDAYELSSTGKNTSSVTLDALLQWTWIPPVGLLGIYTILLFPDGKLPSRRWRPFAWFAGVVMVLASLAVTFGPGPIDGHPRVRNPFGLEGYPVVTQVLTGTIVLLPICILASAASLFVRYRHSGREVRQQIKWLAFAASFVGVVYLSTLVMGFLFAPEAMLGGDETPVWLGIVQDMLLLSFTGIPAAVGFAVLKYRLYDIDIIINRTLVYGVLTVSVVGLYMLIVAALDLLFRARGGLAVSLVAAGVVAVVFAPLRERLQRSVNRLMYGERDDPYAVLSRMGRRLEATFAPKAALSTIVETIAQALKVPYVAIEIRQDAEQFAKVAEHGSPKEEPLVLPLVYQRETMGRLVVAPRARRDAFSPADRRLLEDLARQVEVAVHAVRLTADLQRSRERLVTAREEERRRLRRDLHDGLGPTLGALTLGLDTTRLALAQDDPKAVEALLMELKSQAQEAVSDVRRLVYGLRPPALDDLGLVPAIQQQAANRGLLADAFPNGQGPRWENSKNGLVFRVKAPDDLPSLPAAVEVACYRIAQEAITNTARHSGASSCLVSLCLDEADGTLQLEVSDDGKGVAEDRSAGVGMSSMRERAEELGGTLTVGALPEGGTRILARLPLPAREVPRGEKRSS
jgi:signal transduction histidine kinase